LEAAIQVANVAWSALWFLGQAPLQSLLALVTRMWQQKRSDRGRDKVFALHAPEVACIAKGNSAKPYEFGNKVSIAVSHKPGLMGGARSYPGNPFDGHTLNDQLEEVTNLLQDIGVKPHTAVVDLGFRVVDADDPSVEIIHRGKLKNSATSNTRATQALFVGAHHRPPQEGPRHAQMLIEG
jgi:IS5 family transposase